MPVEPEVPVVELVADPVVPVDDVDVLDLPEDIFAFASMNSELVPAVVVALLVLEGPVACFRQPVTVTLSLSVRSVALLLVVGCWATSVAQATTLIATRVLDHTLLLIRASNL